MSNAAAAERALTSFRQVVTGLYQEALQRPWVRWSPSRGAAPIGAETISRLDELNALRESALIAGTRVDERPTEMGRILNRVRNCREDLCRASCRGEDLPVHIDRLVTALAPLDVLLTCLRAILPAPPEQERPDLPTPNAASEGNGAPGKQRGKGTVNQRMLEHLQANPESAYWTQREWANHLGCSAPAVAGAPAWQNVKIVRALAKAERLDLRRRPRRK
jgi:hypothetical protein